MKHLATAETQLRALHMVTAWRNEMYRTCRLEKDNGLQSTYDLPLALPMTLAGAV